LTCLVTAQETLAGLGVKPKSPDTLTMPHSVDNSLSELKRIYNAYLGLRKPKRKSILLRYMLLHTITQFSTPRNKLKPAYFVQHYKATKSLSHQNLRGERAQ